MTETVAKNSYTQNNKSWVKSDGFHKLLIILRYVGLWQNTKYTGCFFYFLLLEHYGKKRQGQTGRLIKITVSEHERCVIELIFGKAFEFLFFFLHTFTNICIYIYISTYSQVYICEAKKGKVP